MTILYLNGYKLERLSDKHIDGLMSIVSDETVMKHIANGKTWPREKLANIVRYAQEDWKKDIVSLDGDPRGYFWAILSHPESANPVVGMVGIDYHQDLRIFIGRDHQKKGLGTMATREVLDYFQTYNADREVKSAVHIDNEGSRRLMEKLGLTRTGESRIGNVPVMNYVLPKRAQPEDIADAYPFGSWYLPSFSHMLERLQRDIELDVHYKEPALDAESENLGYIVRDYPDHANLSDSITDLRVEDVRSRCILKNAKVSPYSYWENHKEEFNDHNPYINKEVLYNKVRGCNLFNIYLAIRLLRGNDPADPVYWGRVNAAGNPVKGPGRVLDPASGWGDRLGAAFIAGAECYHGWDTNKSLQQSYSKLAEEYADNGLDIRDGWKVTPSPFENAKLTETYDTVMTSPPYFTVELYEGEHTSTNIYKSRDSWFNDYYKPMWRNAAEALRPGGRIMAYIADWMLNETDEVLRGEFGFDYLGKLGFIQHIEGAKGAVRNTFIWRKPLGIPESAATETKSKSKSKAKPKAVAKARVKAERVEQGVIVHRGDNGKLYSAKYGLMMDRIEEPKLLLVDMTDCADDFYPIVFNLPATASHHDMMEHIANAITAADRKYTCVKGQKYKLIEYEENDRYIYVLCQPVGA